MSTNKRKIAVISGKRGGFGAMLPLLQMLDQSEKTELCLIVTDQHLYKNFGHTVNEVERWFKIAHKVYLDQRDDRPLSRAQAIGVCLSKMAEVLEVEKPDALLILGDRGESLAGAIAALNLGIPIAHIQGGDLSGSVDEFYRHAITKMSHIHFPSTAQSAERIRRMGEDDKRIFVVGDCHLDLIYKKKFTPKEELIKKFNIDPSKPLLLVLQHSVTTEPELAQAHMREIGSAIKHLHLPTILVYPCTDQGYEGIISGIEELRPEPFVQIFKNIEAHDFWGLQSVASVFLGNSSAGLIETPCFGLPSITIGKRQTGRERAANCLYAEPKADAIIAALNKSLYDETFRDICRTCDSPYGKGGSGEKMFDVLSTFPLNRDLFEKKMTY